MKTRVSCVALIVMTLLAPTASWSQEFYPRARQPVTNLYLYGGFGHSSIGDDADDSAESKSSSADFPLELLVIRPDDVTFAVQTSAVFDDRSNNLKLGTTSVSAGKGIRLARGNESQCARRGGLQYERRLCDWLAKGLDLISLDAGYMIAGSAPTTRQNDALFARARVQGGWTRLGFDASLMVSAPPGREGSELMTWSAGYRGQFFGSWHLGVDYGEESEEGTGNLDRSWADLVVMHRTYRVSYYGMIRKQLSGVRDGLYFGVGWELRHEL